tara:strand:+ start:4000 stop:4437 length:438 start_codon:yes stop_codon:yes gene_type:complete
MVNYLFDKLPLEIIEYIYSLRLHYHLQKIYYTKISQKTAIINLTINNNFNVLSIIETNILGNNNKLTISDYYIDPIDKKNYFILKKISNILSNNDDIEWWFRMFIYPLENGIGLRESLFNNSDINIIQLENCKMNLVKFYNKIMY